MSSTIFKSCFFASAVISDVNGNDLDTSVAIPSDNTLTVNDPVPNGGSITNDFQRRYSIAQVEFLEMFLTIAIDREFQFF